MASETDPQPVLDRLQQPQAHPSRLEYVTRRPLVPTFPNPHFTYLRHPAIDGKKTSSGAFCDDLQPLLPRLHRRLLGQGGGFSFNSLWSSIVGANQMECLAATIASGFEDEAAIAINTTNIDLRRDLAEIFWRWLCLTYQSDSLYLPVSRFLTDEQHAVRDADRPRGVHAIASQRGTPPMGASVCAELFCVPFRDIGGNHGSLRGLICSTRSMAFAHVAFALSPADAERTLLRHRAATGLFADSDGYAWPMRMATLDRINTHRPTLHDVGG